MIFQIGFIKKRKKLTKIKFKKFLISDISNLLKNGSGFSLIEILLIVIIVGFIILVIATIPNSLFLVGQSKNESLAKEIANKQIEDLRNKTYDNLCDPTNGPCTDNIVDSRLTNLPKSQGTNITDICPISVCTNSEKIKQITVKVDWYDGKISKEVSLVTFIAEGGLK